MSTTPDTECTCGHLARSHDEGQTPKGQPVWWCLVDSCDCAYKGKFKTH